MKKEKRRHIIVFALLCAVLLGLVFLNIIIGSVSISAGELAQILFKGDALESANAAIIWKIRLPRLAACVVLGGALALSGYLLQTFFCNPIAGPYILGISSGAKLVVALLMTFSASYSFALTQPMLITAAFIGSIISLAFVLLLSQRVSRASMLIVGGVMIGYICSAITDFVVTFADDSNIVNLHNWSLGSFSGINWSDVGYMSAVVGVSFVCILMMSKPLGAYLLGEVYAANMGVNIKRFRFLLILFASILAACVTAFAGPISFVGMAVPYLVKSLLKTSKPLLVIPASFLGGAIFCIGCDLIARTVAAPTELSISSVTAVFGAPVVIAIMVHRKNEGIG